jgi:hypothetical protein
MSTPVTSLLTEACKCEQHFGKSGFAAALRLANAVAGTIQLPLVKALFVAEAASTLAEFEYQPEIFEPLVQRATWLAEDAEEQRPTPQGSRELWGSLLQFLYPASAEEV